VSAKKKNNILKKVTENDIENAQRVHEKFFGRRAEKIHVAPYDGGERVLVEMGEVISIRYRAMKHEDEKPGFYEHEFTAKTRLFFDPANDTLILFNRDLEITKAGIEG